MKRTIADVQVGERVAVRVRGQWQRWATVRRVTATQIVTTGPNDVVTESRWARRTGREKGYRSGSYYWSDIALPEPRDEAWAARQRALARVERALAAVRGQQEHEWAQVPEEIQAAMDRMGAAAKELYGLLTGEGA